MSEAFTIIDIDGSAHKVTQAGLLWIYGDKSVAAAPTLLADAERIPDYGRNLKRPAAIRDRLHRLDYGTETRYLTHFKAAKACERMNAKAFAAGDASDRYYVKEM